jgi:hypothetical protein
MNPTQRPRCATMSADSIRIMCPSLTCRRVLSVPTSARGKTVRCRNCGTNIKVPANTSAAAASKPDAKSQTGK